MESKILMNPTWHLPSAPVMLGPPRVADLVRAVELVIGFSLVRRAPVSMFHSSSQTLPDDGDFCARKT
jgi:hypothetical protein